VQFLGQAQGSLCELQTQLVIAARLGFGPIKLHESADKLSADVSRLLIALVRKMKG